jgi:hypothetical protein
MLNRTFQLVESGFFRSIQLLIRRKLQIVRLFKLVSIVVVFTFVRGMKLKERARRRLTMPLCLNLEA